MFQTDWEVEEVVDLWSAVGDGELQHETKCLLADVLGQVCGRVYTLCVRYFLKLDNTLLVVLTNPRIKIFLTNPRITFEFHRTICITLRLVEFHL